MIGAFTGRALRDAVITAVAVIFFVRAAQGHEPETLLWRGVPLPLQVQLGAERIIRVAGADEVRAGILGAVPAAVSMFVLSGGIHLKSHAMAPFRMIVQPRGREAMLLDVTVTDEPVPGSAIIQLSGPPAGPRPPAGGGLPPPADQSPGQARPARDAGASMGDLVRHAARTLYAPERLVPQGFAGGIAPVPLRSYWPFALYQGGAVSAVPVGCWRAAATAFGRAPGLWVTAVKLKNKTARPVTLDPRRLRGRLRAAAFMHARLAAQGQPGDVTVAFLVTGHRFEQAMGPFAPRPPPDDPRGAKRKQNQTRK